MLVWSMLATVAAYASPGDRDDDHIPDMVDQCPDERETYNGCDDQDGCSDASGGALSFGLQLESWIVPFPLTRDTRFLDLAKMIESIPGAIEVVGYRASREPLQVAKQRGKQVPPRPRAANGDRVPPSFSTKGGP